MLLAVFPRSIRSLLMLTLFERRELADLRYIRDLARDFVKLEGDKRKKRLEDDAAGKSGVRSDPPNIISVWLDEPNENTSRGEIDDDEVLMGHIIIFLVGALKTTSASFQWMILELCKHPEVQTRLREEIQAHHSSLSFPSSLMASQLESLPYLRAVVDEILRLHPTVALTEHEATRDTVIAGIPLPKGTLLLCPPQAANLNPRIWGGGCGLFLP
jgi:cytochrome P450